MKIHLNEWFDALINETMTNIRNSMAKNNHLPVIGQLPDTWIPVYHWLVGCLESVVHLFTCDWSAAWNQLSSCLPVIGRLPGSVVQLFTFD